MRTSIINKGGSGRRGGFTLTEMLAVVMLVALLASAGGGMYIRSYHKRLGEKAAWELLQAAQYGRIVAIERNQPCRLSVDERLNIFYLAVDVTNELGEVVEQKIISNQFHKAGQLSGGMAFEYIKVIPSGAEEEQTDTTINEIVFMPNGTADQAVVQMGDGLRHFTISVSAATGRASLIMGTAAEVSTIDSFDLDMQWMLSGNKSDKDLR